MLTVQIKSEPQYDLSYNEVYNRVGIYESDSGYLVIRGIDYNELGTCYILFYKGKLRAGELCDLSECKFRRIKELALKDE